MFDALRTWANVVQSISGLTTHPPVLLPNTSAPDVRTGGILIVADRTVAMRDLTSSLQRAAGLKSVATSRELGDEQPPDVDAIVLERAGVIVVPARQEGMVAVNRLADRLTDVKIEPERFSWATEIDPVWLRGYRDGINALYDSAMAKGASPAGIEPTVSYVDGPTESWGLQAVGVSPLQLTGRGIRVAVLDTGIDQGHPSFDGRIADTRSFVRKEAVADSNGHGTHCAGTIAVPKPTRPLGSVSRRMSEFTSEGCFRNAGWGTDTATSSRESNGRSTGIASFVYVAGL